MKCNANEVGERAVFPTKKMEFKQMVARQTRSPMRSILSVCEQSGYRSLTQQTLLKNIF